MIDYDSCRKVLEQDGGHYSQEQIKLMADLLWEYAQLTVDLFLNDSKQKDNEASHSDGPGKL